MKHFGKLTAWILAAAILCLAAAGAPAAAAEEEESVYSVVSDLVDSFNANPAAGEYLDGEENANAYCAKLYGYIDVEKVPGIFYGGPDEAAELMKQLNLILYEDDRYSDVGLEDAEIFYVCVWAIAHDDVPSQEKSRPAVKEVMKDVFEGCSEDAVYTAVDLCMDYIGQYEPDISDTGYVMTTDAIALEGNEEYTRYYREGSQLFDEGKYTEAIAAYSRCLEYSSHDLPASFEIIEACIAMRDYKEARSRLTELAPYVTGDKYIARWLRRMGFIESEEMNYEMGYALFACSLKFEDSSLAKDEIRYIQLMAPDTREFTADEAETYLKEKGISFAP